MAFSQCFTPPCQGKKPATPVLAAGKTSACIGSSFSYVFTSTDVPTFNWSITPSVGWSYTTPPINCGEPQRTITWNTSGTYTITVYASNSCGASPSMQFNVTVFNETRPPDPTTFLIAGPATVCLNTSSNYSVDPIVGTDWKWSFNQLTSASAANTITSLQNTATVAWNASGWHRLEARTFNGFCESNKPRTIDVAVLTTPIVPTIYGDITSCVNTTSYHTIQTPGIKETYSWSVPDGAGIAVPNGTTSTGVDWTQTGVHQVKVSAANQCFTGPEKVFNVNVGTPGPPPGQIRSNLQAVNCIDGSFDHNFTVNAVAGATQYEWEITTPLGTSIFNTFDNYLFQRFSNSLPGDYSVTVRSMGLCLSPPSASYSYKIFRTPSVSISSAFTAGCVNVEATYQATFSPDYSYLWSASGGQIISSVNNKVKVKWNASGPQKLSVTVTNQCGSKEFEKNVTVIEPSESFMLGSTTTCAGTQYPFEIVTDASSTVTWQALMFGQYVLPPVSNARQVAIRWPNPGYMEDVKAQITNACGVFNVSMPITVNSGAAPAPAIPIDGNRTPCPFKNEVYTVPQLSNNNYIWKVGNDLIPSTNNSANITWASSGNQIVSVTSYNSNCQGNFSKASVMVGVAPESTIAVTGSTETCPGNSIVMNAKTGANLTYQWNLEGVPITGANSNQYNAISSGTYSVTTANALCGQTSLPVTIKVGNLEQVISFNPLLPTTFGETPVTLSATSTSGLPVTFVSANPAIASITGNILTIVGAGTINITAKQPGNSCYSAAVDQIQTLTVNKATLTATAESTSRIYGNPNAPLTTSYVGFKGTDNSTVIDTPPISTTTAAQFSNVGSYPITPSGGVDNNYDFIFIPGTLTITKAPLTVKADNKAKAYGDINPPLTLSYSGFQGTENISVIDSQPAPGSSVPQYGNVGGYQINVTGGIDNNYEIIPVNGTLTINKAPLTVTFANKTKIYGAVNPAFTFTYSGFKGSETSSVIDVPPVGVSTTQFSNVGTYPITLGTGSDNNYALISVDGTLTITKSTLTATAQNKAKAYGIVIPALTVTYSGFKGTDNAADLDSPPIPTTSATQYSDVATYPILLGSGSDNNYNIATNNGTLTVTKKALTATAQNKTKIYGDINPTLTIKFSGFAGTDDISILDSPPLTSTTATSTSNVGSYPITLTPSSDNNYTVTIVDGILTVNKSTLTATAQGATRVYGVSNPVFNITYIGFKGSDNLSVIDSAPTATTTATPASNVGNFSITVSGGLDNNYSFGYVSATLTITKANQTITFGALSPLCVGNISTLVGTATSGLPVTYVSSNSTIASISAITLTAKLAGTVTITASQIGNTNYNAAPPVPQILLVNAPALITASVEPVCVGKSVVMVGTPLGGTWIGTGVTGNSFSAASLSAGTYNVVYSYTTPSGCKSSKSATVSVLALPQIANFSFFPASQYVCPSQHITFTVAMTGGNESSYTYSWVSQSDWTATHPSVNQAKFTVNNSNFGPVQVTVKQGQCEAKDGVTFFPGTCMANLTTSLVPNPANEEVVLELEKSSEKSRQIKIYDQLGKVVKADVLKPGEQSKTLDTSALASGLYLIHVISQEEIVQKKLLVEHNN